MSDSLVICFHIFLSIIVHDYPEDSILGSKIVVNSEIQDSDWPTISLNIVKN